jgi:hypothetical protein
VPGIRGLQRQSRVALALRQHRGEIDVPRLEARRVRVRKVGGEHAHALALHHERLFVNAKDIFKHLV